MKRLLALLSVLAGTSVTMSQETTAAILPRLNLHARLEPAHTVLHGAGQDFAAFKRYTDALGSRRIPRIYMTYIGLTRPVAEIKKRGHQLRSEFNKLPSDDIIPQIGLSMVGGKDTGAGQDAEVARGDYDQNIQAFVDALKSLGRPVFVRIGYECEGSWNGYHPDTYRNAFIHITHALRAAHLDAATVWCVGGGSSGSKTVDALMPFYPGDRWVDWWSIDLFSSPELTSPLTDSFCQAATQHRKPVMIGESTPRYVGVLDGERSWNTWFKPYFKLIHREPDIKAFCYIDWEWKSESSKLGFHWEDWGDARIEQNPYVLRHYERELDRPLYSNARPHRKSSVVTPPLSSSR